MVCAVDIDLKFHMEEIQIPEFLGNPVFENFCGFFPLFGQAPAEKSEDMFLFLEDCLCGAGQFFIIFKFFQALFLCIKTSQDCLLG